MTTGPHIAAASIRSAIEALAGSELSFAPIGLGWATVELDRASHAFADVFGEALRTAESTPDDVLLGARCRRLEIGESGLLPVILLEPSTEGRLAASLARHGEGPVAVWLRWDRASGLVAPGPPGSRPSVAGAGPFGMEVLRPGDPAAGPHRLLVPVEPGTITP